MNKLFAFLLILGFAAGAAAAPPDDKAVAQRLQGFDAYMAKVLKDWNVPGIGIGIVVNDKVVLAKGYGYRDYGKKLPYTAQTVQPIASNTKLFTAMDVGFLVEEGKIEWDKPARRFVPSIRFYNDELDNTVTVRDMLSHRTGITRHDSIWYKSEFTRDELFQRLRYLEPSQPARTTFLYNNMMYVGSGRIVELLSGKTWEDFTREKILGPLGMTSTGFTIADLKKQANPAVPFTERRDSFELYQIPYYDDEVAVGPAGAIVSNVDDMTKWLTALMNDGKFQGKQVLPAAAVKATLEPTLAMANSALESRGWGELLNSAYGMGRWTASYRGNLIAFHGGDINGFHSQVSLMPTNRIGVVVLVIGDHAAPLYNPISYNIYERLLGMDETPWVQRQLDIRLKGKEASKQARAKAGEGQVAGTKPSHPLDAFTGEFVHPAYGVLKITTKDNGLAFEFHKIAMPLTHFHYDRFDSADDEQDGKWSVNFVTSPQGEIDKAVMSLDEAEVAFTRQASAELSSLATLSQYAGDYTTPTGGKFKVAVEHGILGLVFAGQPFQELIPWKPRMFRVKEFADVTFEFVVEGGAVKALKQKDPSGEFTFPKQ